MWLVREPVASGFDARATVADKGFDLMLGAKLTHYFFAARLTDGVISHSLRAEVGERIDPPRTHLDLSKACYNNLSTGLLFRLLGAPCPRLLPHGAGRRLNGTAQMLSYFISTALIYSMRIQYSKNAFKLLAVPFAP